MDDMNLVFPQEDFGDVTERRDGSYVIARDGMPYHVTVWNPLYPDVGEYAREHPDRVTAEPEPAPPTLEEVRAAKRNELMLMRDEIVAQGFSYGGYIFPIGSNIQTTMLMQFQSSQLMPAPSYPWKDIHGIYRQIGDASAFQTFAMAAMMYGQSLYAWEEMLQSLANASEDVETVRSITWDTVPNEPV